MTDQEMLNEIMRLLHEAYEHYFANSDGHCKSSEGHVSLGYGTYFDRRDGKTGVQSVEVYSYVLGPSRSHHFGDLGEALDTVRGWHASEMAHDYEADEAAWGAAWDAVDG